MASNLGNVTGMFKNVKTRTLIIITAAVVVFGLFLAMSGLHRNNDGMGAGIDASANLPSAPRISGDPDILGNRQVSQQRARLTKEADDQAVWNAAAQGGSALPTTFDGSMSSSGQDINQYNQQQQQKQQKQQKQQQAESDALDKLISDAKKLDPSQQQSATQSDAQHQKILAALNRESPEDAQDDREAAQLQADIQGGDSSSSGSGDDLSTAMATEVKQLLTSWNPTPQQYVAGEANSQSMSQTTQNGVGNSSVDRGATPGAIAAANNINSAAGGGGTQQPPLLQAGSILFATLETAVNTDEPGPIMAKVTVGPYKGAKLLGGLQPAGAHAEGVALSFNTMILPNYTNSIGINAYAIDPNTARTAIATEVDHHYLLRYGTLFASSFLSGIAQAVSMSGQTTVNSALGGSTNVMQQLSPTDKLLYALGNVGTTMSDEVGTLANRPTTIKVAAGTGVGILCMKDITAPPISQLKS